ncbi:leader peptide IlvL [Shewanella morhuae]|nr:leader peptide IlvL [Shewanella sp. WE21]AVT47349.1 leader peptide IlvL [Shewanella baltica]EGT3627639.1 leader peptide IlvL [Morganella morganii]PIW61580.1 MAG: leader peptide IlvL [Shewanella sp. CG12_big_fil_rev_8_21_14_0_65_47_15]PTA48371.1 leader peptide IlvL [Shewanella morhuae]QGS48332.1 leader peptide IlvL [Shewanella putrefaciens]
MMFNQAAKLILVIITVVIIKSQRGRRMAN